MPFFDPIRIGAAGAVAADYTVDRSLRFNTTDQTVLTKTLSTSPTNRKKTTLSFWFKKSKLSTSQGVITSGASGTGGSSSGTRIHFNSDDTIKVATQVSNSTVWAIDTNRKFRDPSAWMHFCMSLDTTQSTASDRVKIYINGVQETSFSSASYPSQDYDDIWAYSNYRIGDYGGDYGYYIGYQSYIAEVITIDGQALDPSSFTETDATTGQLVPKDPSGLTFGTNGFHLKFADNSGTTATTLGKDSSGNGNNFTPNNLAVSDAVKDSPTNNFCVFNPLSKDGGTTLSDGNLKISSANYGNNTGTFFLTSGKWYWEGLGSGYVIGICGNEGQNYTGSASGTGGKSIGYWFSSGLAYWDGGNSGTGTGYSTSDVVAAALDMDNGTIKFYKNNTLIHDLTFGSGTVPDLSAGVFPIYNNGQTTPTKTANYNFGQDSSFAGNKTAQGNTDGSGQGDFYYSPPSGYKAICSANLPDPTILLPNQHFDTVLYTGTGSSNSITGLDFAPDFVWAKRRDTSGHHHLLIDQIRGGNASLMSNNTDAENTNANRSMTFNSNGVTWNSDTGNANASGGTYVLWNWNAGGSTASNSDGSITSSVRANTTAGFSIATYTGNGTADATVGHGLGVAPEAVIVKKRSGTDNWQVYWIGAGTERNGYLNLSNAFNTPAQTDIWGTNVPTSTKFYLGTDTATNASGSTYVAYVFSGVEGYSKFGEYEGNGSTDGTFVYTGFAPAFLITRKIPETNWHMLDIDRDPSNPNTLGIDPNNSNAEADDSNLAIDFLSNGFKLRTSHSTSNGNATGYIYFAFAESPFKNARAR